MVLTPNPSKDDEGAMNGADAAAYLARRPDVVIVAVSTAWCPPCRQMRPVFRKLAFEFATPAIVVNGDAAANFNRAHGIDGFPTRLVFRTGMLIETAGGYDGPEALRRWWIGALGLPPDGAPSRSECAFRQAIASAEAAIERIMGPASEALAPHIESMEPHLEAYRAAMAREVAAGRLSDRESRQRQQAERARLFAPLRQQIDALREAQDEAFATYETMADAAVRHFMAEFDHATPAALGSVDLSRRPVACDPDDPFCALS